MAIAAETDQDRKRYAALKETRAREFVIQVVSRAAETLRHGH